MRNILGTALAILLLMLFLLFKLLQWLLDDLHDGAPSPNPNLTLTLTPTLTLILTPTLTLTCTTAHHAALDRPDTPPHPGPSPPPHTSAPQLRPTPQPHASALHVLAGGGGGGEKARGRLLRPAPSAAMERLAAMRSSRTRGRYARADDGDGLHEVRVS